MINRQIKKEMNISEEDYRKWCKKNKKNIHSNENKKEFFRLILDEKLKKGDIANV